jgi:hypothetical protein
MWVLERIFSGCILYSKILNALGCLLQVCMLVLDFCTLVVVVYCWKGNQGFGFCSHLLV